MRVGLHQSAVGKYQPAELSKQTPAIARCLYKDVGTRTQLQQWLPASTIYKELGTDFFDSFQQYKINHAEIALFDITTGTDRSCAGVVYIAPYPWSVDVGDTQDTPFNIHTLPGCQWKTMNIPMTQFGTATKAPEGGIGNTQMLTVPLTKPMYMMQTFDGVNSAASGENRSNRFVLTNTGEGRDDGRWYGWLIEYNRYSTESAASISGVSFHFMIKYNVTLSGFRPLSIPTAITSKRKRRSVTNKEYDRGNRVIYNVNEDEEELERRDPEQDNDGT